MHVEEEWRMCEYLQIHFRSTVHTDVSTPGGSRLADGYQVEDVTEQSGCISKTASFYEDGRHNQNVQESYREDA